MSLLEHDTTREEQMNKFVEMLKFEPDTNKKYKVEAIWDIAIYVMEANGHLSGLYYLIACKGYTEEENTWKLSLIVLHLQKMVNIFYKNHSEKSISTSLLLVSALPMAKPTI